MPFDKKEYQKEYREKNKEKLKEYKKEWCEKNRDEIKEYQKKNKEYHKEYYEKNKSKILEQKKEYNEKTKEKKKEYTKQYREKNKDKILEYQQTPAFKKSYRISKWRRSGVIHHNFDELYEKFIQTEKCELCNVQLTVDKKTTQTTRVLDHCHSSGLFRNVVCHSCNCKLPRQKS
tara:strand:+ start:296 stop:820 length:525 start_codon:yes stop_codon:yes gene_type:complete